MNKRIIVLVAFVVIVGFSITVILPGGLSLSTEQQVAVFLDGPCTDTCTVVLDLNNNGVCDPDSDLFKVVPNMASPAGDNPIEYPYCS